MSTVAEIGTAVETEWTNPPSPDLELMPALSEDSLPRPILPRTIEDLRRWYLLPHPQAPYFSRPEGAKDALVVLRQLAAEVSSQTPQLNDFIRDLLFQASLTNLWFFLKVILGAYGPYDKLNTHIHLEMANARQFMTYDGCRGAICIFRNAYKSTIATHGGNTWEILRDPNMTIGLACMKVERAEGFVEIIQHNFDANPLLAEVAPAYVPPQAYKEKWNRGELVCPARTRFTAEPSIKAMGAEGAQEGLHFDLLNMDDISGTRELDAERMSNVDMEKKRNWAKTSDRTLLKDLIRSRIVSAFTRYSEDDVYGDWFKDSYQFVGPADDINDPDNIRPHERGRWVIYYSSWHDSQGKSRFPEKLSVSAMEALKEDDWWTYATQYENKPWAAGQAEFIQHSLKPCDLEWLVGEPIIHVKRKLPGGTEPIFAVDDVRVAECHAVISIDPAASDKGISAKTSRSVIQAWCQDWRQWKFLLEERAGFWSVPELWDQLFQVWERWGPWMSCVWMEQNGPFKMLGPILQQECHRRQVYIPHQGDPSTGDKVAQNRSTVGNDVGLGRVAVVRGTGQNFETELRAFPQSHRMDSIDAARVAFRNLRVPDENNKAEWPDVDPDDVEQYSYEASGQLVGANETTGY